MFLDSIILTFITYLILMNTKVKHIFPSPGVIVHVENEKSIAILKGIFMIALNVDAVVVIQVKEQSV